MTEKRFIPIFDGFDKRVVGAKDNGRIISFMGMFDLLNELHNENQRLLKMLDNVANAMQKQNKDIPIDDFVEWWNKIATEGLDD